MATDKAQTINLLRTKVLNESLQKDGGNRYGLFSYPPAGISGTGDYDFNKSKRLGNDGKPLTKPRGLFFRAYQFWKGRVILFLEDSLCFNRGQIY
jgi:hypothetical protein